MSKKFEERNNIIVRLFSEGKKIPEVKYELIQLGYPEISRNRLWTIWQRSNFFKPRRERLLFCNFCLENKNPKKLYYGYFKNSYKAKFRMCQICFDKLIPPQPIKQI